MKLAVTGGRKTHVSDEDWQWLLDAYEACGADGFIIGDCPTGVDFEVWERLKADGRYPFERYLADWDKYGRGGGMVRNGEMIKDADALVSFSGGPGTANCTERAKKKGIYIFRR